MMPINLSRKSPPGRFFIKSLGCPKNTADSELIETRLLDAGMVPALRPSDAAVVIVNTCGFIDIAKEESIDALLRYSEHKRPRQKVIGAGCLTQRYGADITKEIPKLDAVVGVEAWNEIAEIAANGEGDESLPPWIPRRLTSQTRASTYLKIADGCSAPCTFCSIPTIKGLWRSKPEDAIVAEAKTLVASGVKELILVAQDTTAYGFDRQQRDALAPLIERILEAAPDLRWVRLMYAYPGHVTDRMIDLMRREPRVANYIDIPLQHAHPAVLQRMKRPAPSVTRKTLEKLRTAIPDVAIRTAFIVGSPGETNDEFQELLDFMESFEFDRVGVFTYSQEEGTPLAEAPDQLPERVKRQRLARAMRLQQRISLKRQQTLVGRTLDVLVEGTAAASIEKGDAPADVDFVGRSYRDAPEVDGYVFATGRAEPGEMVSVRIKRALDHDLVGELV